MENKIDFLGKKFVEVTMKVVIEYDAKPNKATLEQFLNTVL